MISDDNLGLNLCVILTIYHIVVTLNIEISERSERRFLENSG